MDDIVTQYDELMTDLLASRRTDALTLRSQLKRSNEDKSTLESKVSEMEAQMLDMASKIQMYSERLGIV